MDDYYSLLGVDSDATVDDIRSAYRSRKDSIDAASDTGKADVARLNKAWNVLSDPYQRGRYDEQRSSAEESGELVAPDDVEVVSSNGARGGKSNARPPARGRQPGPPTITPPAGTSWPAPRQRLIAMAIDLLVLLALFLAAGFIGEAMAKNQHPAAYKTEQQLNKTTAQCAQHPCTIAEAQKDVDNAKKAQTAANKTTDQAAKDKANQAVTVAENNQKAVQKQLDDASSKLTLARFTAIGLFFLIGMLYLVIPTMFGGRTLGKRFQHLKLLREDGSPARAGDAIKRYGTLVIVTFALFTILRLGPLAGVIVIVGVTTWMRNNNQQGLHDRFAHTIVVSDA